MTFRYYHHHADGPEGEHAEHEHAHHDPAEHSHTHELPADQPLSEKDMALRLLEHMWEHNAHHLEELKALSKRFDALHLPHTALCLDVAAERMADVDELLHQALHTAEEESTPCSCSFAPLAGNAALARGPLAEPKAPSQEP